MNRMTREAPAVADLTATEMYGQTILIQLGIPSYSSAISFTLTVAHVCPQGVFSLVIRFYNAVVKRFTRSPIAALNFLLFELWSP